MNKKGKETDKWLRELYRKRDNLLSMKNYSRTKKDKKPEKFWQALKIKTARWLLMNESLIDWFKSKELRKKRNNRTTGKRNKRPELTCFIKSTMIGNEKLETITRLKKRSFGKKNKTNKKSKKESNNMKLSKKLVGKDNTKNQNNNNKSFSNKSPRRKRREDWSS